MLKSIQQGCQTESTTVTSKCSDQIGLAPIHPKNVIIEEDKEDLDQIECLNSQEDSACELDEDEELYKYESKMESKANDQSSVSHKRPVKKESKKLVRKKKDSKMWRFADTIGVEDNDRYPKFRDRERLLINLSNCKYFVIKFVAKEVFNFRLSFKQ